MLDEQPVGGDVVAVDDQAVIADVAGPADACP
jgi:hypothetical protein